MGTRIHRHYSPQPEQVWITCYCSTCKQIITFVNNIATTRRPTAADRYGIRMHDIPIIRAS